ncbi:MAG: component of SufBCD complex [Hasllibacter sp.]
MDFYARVFEAIDLRSFSNLWYWIGLAVFWSSVSYWVLGVPWDLVQRARRGDDPERVQDVQDLVRVNVNRLLLIGRVSGLATAATAAFVLTLLTVLAFWYGIEFAQAVFFIAAPGALVGALSVVRAHRIAEEQAVGDGLYRHLLAHRRTIQVIGMLSIFVTAMFGMYQNLALGAWG